MRVIYYTYTPYLDGALARVQSLAPYVELHLVLEVSPEAWRSNIFDISPMNLPEGIIPVPAEIRNSFPANLQTSWEECASFHLMVYNQPRSIHPKTWLVGRSLCRFVEDLRPDVFHMDSMSLRLAPQLSCMKNVAVIQNVHDAVAHVGERDWRRGLTRLLTFPHVQKFLFHSRHSQALFLTNYRIAAERTAVVPFGVFDVFRSWGAPVHQDERTILFFGRLSPYKGLETFFEAAKRVSQSMSGLRFVVAGKPNEGYRVPLPPTLENDCRWEIVDRYLTSAEIARIVQQATFVVCPYIEASQSGVVLTAYAFNKPVIATNVGGLPEYVWHNETGLLVPPRDAEALALAITRLITQPETRLRMAVRIEEKCNHELNWDEGARRIVAIYSQVTGTSIKVDVASKEEV